ncbi:MAG: PKD domain-containing protein, partial [Nitrospinota bacterium]|nr:PKD domain-containing protein [Nitrospinota bacterium]
MARRVIAAAFFTATFCLLSFSSCGGPGGVSGQSSAAVKMGIKLQWPDGVTYDKTTSALNIPQYYLPPSAAVVPAYLTDAEVVLMGEGMPSMKMKVDINNAIARFSVQPGEYTVQVGVWTSIGVVFTGRTGVYLHGGDNGTIRMTLAVNAPPEWISVTVSNSTPVTGEVITLKCVVSDPDGDPITYTWSGGGVSATGSVVTYTVPDEEPHTFTCTASDGYGGKMMGSVSINSDTGGPIGGGGGKPPPPPPPPPPAQDTDGDGVPDV